MNYSNKHGKKKEKHEAKKYFDYNFTKNITKIIESDPYFALEEIEEYLKEYPDDYTLRSTCISILITIGEFEEAEKRNEEFRKFILSSEDVKAIDNGKKLKRLMLNTIYNEFRLLANTGDYRRAYDLLIKYKDDLEDKELSNKGFNYNIIFFFRARLGAEFNRDDQRTYACRQIVEYREEDFFDHIKRHMKGEQCDIERDSVFFEDIDLKKIYDEIMKILPDQKPLYRGFVDKTYYFKYDNCGLEGTDVVDYIKLITYGDDSGVITMCPTKDGEKLPHIDLNYLKESDKNKIRKKSQIDKFNQKYGKK